MLSGCPHHSVCALLTFMTCGSKGSGCGRHKGRSARDKGRHKKSSKQTSKQIRGRGEGVRKGRKQGFSAESPYNSSSRSETKGKAVRRRNKHWASEKHREPEDVMTGPSFLLTLLVTIDILVIELFWMVVMFYYWYYWHCSPFLFSIPTFVLKYLSRFEWSLLKCHHIVKPLF